MIGRLLCALGWHSFSAFGREWVAWQSSAETARLRLAWVVGHDRAAMCARHDLPAPAIHGFWSGVQAGAEDGMRQYTIQAAKRYRVAL